MPKLPPKGKEDRERLIAEVMLAVRAFTNAQDVFDDAAVAVLCINRSDGRCLDILDQHGPMTAGELARRADLSTAAMTALVDRMERAGFVTRERDTTDRRRVVIAGTSKAEQKCAAIWAPIAAEGFAMLEGYSGAELDAIRRFMNEGSDFLMRHLDRIKAHAAHSDPDEARSPARVGKIPA